MEDASFTILSLSETTGFYGASDVIIVIIVWQYTGSRVCRYPNLIVHILGDDGIHLEYRKFQNKIKMVLKLLGIIFVIKSCAQSRLPSLLE